jgi:hypothetical protein
VLFGGCWGAAAERQIGEAMAQNDTVTKSLIAIGTPDPRQERCGDHSMARVAPNQQ